MFSLIGSLLLLLLVTMSSAYTYTTTTNKKIQAAPPVVHVGDENFNVKSSGFNFMDHATTKQKETGEKEATRSLAWTPGNGGNEEGWIDIRHDNYNDQKMGEMKAAAQVIVHDHTFGRLMKSPGTQGHHDQLHNFKRPLVSRWSPRQGFFDDNDGGSDGDLVDGVFGLVGLLGLLGTIPVIPLLLPFLILAPLLLLLLPLALLLLPLIPLLPLLLLLLVLVFIPIPVISTGRDAAAQGKLASVIQNNNPNSVSTILGAIAKGHSKYY